MGCLVNGPGEAAAADIAVAGGQGKFALYRRGEQLAVIPESEAVESVLRLVAEWRTP
jgi:(E)-4-hydroxy-3-methylbut-2-enyl-diphosphate synthase